MSEEVEEIKLCPHCNGYIRVIKSRGRVRLKRPKKWKNAAERYAFIKWTKSQGLVYAKDTQEELNLIDQFRREIAPTLNLEAEE